MRHEDDIGRAYWNRLKDGDTSAYAAIYRFYYPRLYNYGFKLCRNEGRTEDCLQELFTWLWYKRAELKNIEKPESYLFVSFRRSLLKASAEAHLFMREPGEADMFFLEPAADESMIDGEAAALKQQYLRKAFDTLTPRQREAVFLRFYEAMPYEEVAAILGLSTKGTYKLVARALGVLRNYSSHHPVLNGLFSIGWMCLALRLLLA